MLIIKRIFKGSSCVFNIGLAFGVFGTVGFKLECSCFVIRSFNFNSAASFLFIAAHDCLMLSVLSFLYLLGLFSFCSTILCTCYLLIMHVALPLSASNKQIIVVEPFIYVSPNFFANVCF